VVQVLARTLQLDLLLLDPRLQHRDALFEMRDSSAAVASGVGRHPLDLLQLVLGLLQLGVGALLALAQAVEGFLRLLNGGGSFRFEPPGIV
jgi:hypothetical protein